MDKEFLNLNLRDISEERFVKYDNLLFDLENQIISSHASQIKKSISDLRLAFAKTAYTKFGQNQISKLLLGKIRSSPSIVNKPAR